MFYLTKCTPDTEMQHHIVLTVNNVRTVCTSKWTIHRHTKACKHTTYVYMDNKHWPLYVRIYL